MPTAKTRAPLRLKLTCGLLLLLATGPACLSSCGANTFEFQVLVNNADGYKVPNARVLLTHTGGSDSRLTDNNGKVSFFLDRQYQGSLATVQVETNGFKPYKKDVKLSPSAQELQIEQIAGWRDDPVGGKTPPPLPPSSNTEPDNSTVPKQPPKPTPKPPPASPQFDYPALRPGVAVDDGRLTKDAYDCYQFAGRLTAS